VLRYLRWRTSPRRVHRAAVRLIEQSGELAFFRAHKQAWAACGREDHRQARFWQMVAGEVTRQVQRQAILARIMAPSPPPPRPPLPPLPLWEEEPVPTPEAAKRPTHLQLVHSGSAPRKAAEASGDAKTDVHRRKNRGERRTSKRR
jgi:hypothetical protein